MLRHLLIVLLGLATPVHAQLAITEFLASNSTGLQDELGNEEDWLEVSNVSTGTVALSGWYLTDEAANLRKWPLPAWTLAAGNRFVVFASNRNRLPAQTTPGADNAGTPASPRLATNFKISANAGGYLGLTKDGAGGAIAVVSSFANYPKQVANVSYGPSITTLSLVTASSPVKALVPTVANGGSTLGASWRGGAEPFDDASWAAGTTGVGRAAAATMVSAANLKLRLNANDAATLVTDTSGAGRNGVNGAGALNLVTFEAATTDTQASPVLRRGAMKFDQAVSPRVTVESASHTDFNSTSGTIMFWMKPGAVAGSGSTGMLLWNRRDSIGTWLVMKGPSDASAGKLFSQTGGGAISFHSNARVDDGQWHHVAFVYNQTAAGTDTFYIDGVASGSVTHGAAWAWPAAQPVTLAYSPSSTFWYKYNGLLDEVRMYNTPLTAPQIASIYNGADEDVATVDVGLSVSAALPGNAGAFLRIPFTVANPATFSSLRLTSRVNDGFVAYLNGLPLDSLNAPASPGFSSVATSTALATRTRVADVSLAGLTSGTNILAIHAMNNSTSDPNFLSHHLLEGVSLDATANYLLTATPGAANGGIRTAIGPFVSKVTGSPGDLVPRPAGGPGSPNITIKATVTPSLRPLAASNPVQLAYRLMFNAEVVVNMTAGAGGVYTASIPTTGLTAGQMLRWRILASDNTAVSTTAPDYLSTTDSDQYYGTVAVDSTSTQLPLYHVFVSGTYTFNNTSPIDGNTGGRASFFYDGELYDNVFIRIKGDTTRNLLKRAHRVDFNSGHQLRWAPGQKRLRELNLNAEYVDPSYSRQFLSMWFHRLSGTGGANHFPVRCHLNGVFWQLAFHTETQDFELLDNLGLDPNGAFYCSIGTMSGAAGEKQTRTTEGTTDMASFVTAITQTNLTTRENNVFDQVDLPAVINYLAAARMMQEADDVWANMCIHRDSDGTGEWRIVPYDLNLSWGQLYYGQQTNHTTLFATADGNKSHPLYGNSLCQTTDYAGAGYNRFYDAIISLPRTRAMLLRRIRSLMDAYLQPPGTVNGFFEQQLDAHIARIAPEVAQDKAQWGWPAVGGPYGLGNDDLTTAVNEIKTLFIAPRRTHYFTTHTSMTNVGIANTNSAGIPSAPQAASFPMTITAYDYNPTDAGKQNAEWIQLTNPNAFDADISGWTLSGGVNFTFKGGTVVPAGASIYVSPRQQSFRARTTTPRGGEGKFIVGPYSGQISARGEIIQLRDPASLLVTSVNTPANPTAGQQQLRITELNFNPAVPTSGELSALPGVGVSDFEWIEILNSGAALNVGGAMFTKGVTFTFPTGFTIAAGARVILVANQPAFLRRYGAGATIAGTFAGNLDNSGEEIEIIDPTGEVILDFRYENSWFPPADGTGRTLVVRNALPNYATYDAPTHWAISGSVNGSPGMTDADFANHFEGWLWDQFTEAEIYLPSPPNPSRTANFALVGPDADADEDGLNNLGEYAFCRNARAQDNYGLTTAGTTTVGPDTFLTITFTRRHKALDLTYTIETSETLDGTWTPTTEQVGPTTDLGNGAEQVTFRDTVPQNASRRFIRVQAMQP